MAHCAPRSGWVLAAIITLLVCAAGPSRLVTPAGIAAAQGAYPEAQISNGQIRATLYLPDARNGFYRSTRFDWSGVIASLEYQGHQYYGPWFTKSDPSVRDFIYKDADIVVSAQSGVVGPAEEFSQPQGYTTAKPGGTFVKIGVGVLRKAKESNYSAYDTYEIVDPGTWTVKTRADAIEFAQEVTDPASGFGYVYRKTVRLVSGRPELVIEHSLQNTGRLPLQATQYNHNFLVLDRAATGPDFTISFPFAVQPMRPLENDLVEIRGNQIVYVKPVAGEGRVSLGIQGFGKEASDYDFRIESRKLGAGIRMRADRPLARVALWSIRSVISLEPFVDVSTEPGKTTAWTYSYEYYGLPK
jgi:hypothetical protein